MTDAQADYTQRINSALAAPVGDETGWQRIETAPKNKKVLAAYKNRLGNWRIVTACYHTQLPWSDDYEPRDSEGEYAPEGWYEESDSNETIYRTSEPPTHWRELPEPPALSHTSKPEGETR